MATRFDNIVRRGAAVLLSAQLVALTAQPSWAQRRAAEPEANPEFSQQVQGASDSSSGGPVSAEPAPAAPDAGTPSADAGTPSPDDSSEHTVQGIQIGASAPAARPASSRESTSPLDARVTVRVKGAPLATFLDTISAQAKINFIITEGLETRRVTAFLQNVTVREALQVLLEIKGLTYQQIGRSNTYVVTPRSKNVENVITRIYTLSFVPLIDLSALNGSSGSSGSSAASSSGGGAMMGGSTGGGGGGGAPTGGGSGATGGASAQALSIVSVLRSVLTSGGKVVLEPRTNSLVVTDVPEVFPQVEQIISELDKKAPQIMIETQIVEIDSSRDKELGIEWGGTEGQLASFEGGARDTSFPMQLPNNLTKTRFLDPIPGPTNVISSLGGSASGSSGSSTSGSTTSNPLVFGSYLKTSVLDLTQLTVTLRALIDRSEARFLGKPKVITLNNTPAHIEIKNHIVTDVEQSLASGGSLTQAQVTAHYQDTGVFLDVTPQVNKDGYVTLLLQPSFTDTQQSEFSVSGNPVFNLVTRSARTLVRVKNGQTVVLGGLLESTETKDVRKVPFLGYIPLIGWLFTSVSDQRTNNDLVIFITPSVVSD